MALTTTITPKELERQAHLVFKDKAYNVFLAYDPNSTLGASSTIAQWETKKIATANGYVDVTGTITAGTYNSPNQRFEMPNITAQFKGTGAGYVYNVVIVQIDNATYPHSFTRLNPEEAISAGQTRSYVIRLIQND